jgi:uncharacterized membrane protein
MLRIGGDRRSDHPGRVMAFRRGRVETRSHGRGRTSLPAPRVTRRRRLAARITDSHWVVPAGYVAGALVLAVSLVRWDETDPLVLARTIDSGSASTALAALGSGMLAFTGFVTSVVLVLVQFGTSEFSPRLVRWLRRDRTLNFALSTFVATFLFALVATAQVGRGDDDFVPTRTLLAALGLTLLSIAMFLMLIDRTANGLRVANVAQRVDATARKVFDTVYPDSAGDEGAAPPLSERPPVQVVRHEGPGAVLVTFDRSTLVGLARRGDAAVELVAAVGDHVPAGGLLLRVHGRVPLSERHLRGAVVLGDERTLDDDPAFALRVLVDVAIRALSPAVNDPTTAVQMLDRIEDLLRYAAVKNLATGRVADGDGVTRLVYPTPTWDDLVELGLDEVRAFGAGQYQIARRVRALLDALVADLPERRHPALLAQRALLEDAVERRFPAPQRRDALAADRQGLGMSRRRVSPG